MRHASIKTRWMAIIVAAVLALPSVFAALAVTYPYDAVCMDYVNMRRYSSSSSTILKRLEPGNVITILEKKGAYYKLQADGKTGYALCVYVDGTDPTPDSSPEPGMVLTAPMAVSSYPYDTTTAGFVKLRKTASETGTVIRTLPTGTLVTVYSVKDSFAKVKQNGTTGYVHTSLVNLANIATPVPQAAATVSPTAVKYTPVKKGDSGTVVRALQEALTELQYLDDKIDSKFGANTETALKLFQKRNGLDETGEADQNLQLLLYEGTPKDEKGYRQYVKTVAPVAGAIIKLNSTGEAVEKAQARLKELGFYSDVISGICAKETVAAITAFEQKNALTQDGVLDANDQNILYGTVTKDSTAVITPSPTPTPQAPKGVVRPKDKSNDAKLVQLRLMELGYYQGKATGTFNDESVKALTAFQKANALTADGVCGIQTRAVLFAAHPIYAVPTAMPITTAGVTTTLAPTYTAITQENAVVIKAGTQGEAVKRMQLRLQELNYYTSRQDGVCLTDDITAIRAFQTVNGLKVDGKAGYNTQTVLYSDVAIAYSAVAGTTTTTTATAILRYGSEGAEVVTLQNRLIALGYLTGAADGKFGAATKAAVVAFQRANNLVRDGAVGATTQAALDSGKAEDNKVPYVTLRIGAVNDAVKDLQNRLIALGYLTGKADGKFGIATNLALIAFQKANGLTADGVLGTKTTKALNATTVTNSAGTTITPTVQTAPSVSTVSAADVRYANWYTEIRAKVRSMPNVTVYDFSTGISWQLNIFSNGAHADAEPLTAEDTANMNRAFGGKTTWTPKAVWVVLSDGTVYMASTHNTPHDTSHNRNNNFDGHLCVHFPRTQAQVESIGPYATSHQKAIDLGWEATQRRAGR